MEDKGVSPPGQWTDEHLLRGTSIPILLSGFGERIHGFGGMPPVPKEEDYKASRRVSSLTFYVAHTWTSYRLKKWLALLLYFNIAPAVFLTIVSMVVGVITCEVVFGGSELQAFPNQCIAQLCSYLFFVYLFLYHHIEAIALCCFKKTVFVDRICVNNTDPTHRERSITSVQTIFKNSEVMLVLWDASFFDNLWCTAQMAAWHVSMAKDIVLIPIERGVTAISLVLGWACCEWLRKGPSLMFHTRPGTMEDSMVSTLSYAITSILIAVNYRGYIVDLAVLRQQLSQFTTQDADSFCCECEHIHPGSGESLPCERKQVNKLISDLWGDGRSGKEPLRKFDAYIRGKFKDFAGPLVWAACQDLPYMYCVGASLFAAARTIDFYRNGQYAPPSNPGERPSLPDVLLYGMDIVLLRNPCVIGIMLSGIAFFLSFTMNSSTPGRSALATMMGMLVWPCIVHGAGFSFALFDQIAMRQQDDVLVKFCWMCVEFAGIVAIWCGDFKKLCSKGDAGEQQRTPPESKTFRRVSNALGTKQLSAFEQEWEVELSQQTPLKNVAFVFIKPLALNRQVTSLVRASLEEAGIRIVSEGDINAREISEHMLIDQHYYSIASKATMLKPEEIKVPENHFYEKFGVEWKDALASGCVLNAKDACERLELTPRELDTLWSEAHASRNVAKFGGGLACGKLELAHKGGTYYVFNGFYMAMRSKFVAKGAAIHYFVVEWDASQLKWSRFRGEVVGKTDPSKASGISLRGKLFEDWTEFGLVAQPDTGDNCVHASASPFESLAERLNWLGIKPEDDNFGQLLLNSGITSGKIDEWSKNPYVSFKSERRSLFDILEDTDAKECLDICKAIAGKK